VKTEHAERAWHAQELEGQVDEREIGVSLTTPTKLEEFREKLYAKVKAEPTTSTSTGC
jgi:hypothetical protein